MKKKITQIDKECAVRGEWSVFNSRNTRLNFTVHSCVKSFSFFSIFFLLWWYREGNRFKHRVRVQKTSWKFLILLFVVRLHFYSYFISFVCFVSTVIKNVLEKITMKHLSIYFFLYVQFIFLWHSTIETIFAEATCFKKKSQTNAPNEDYVLKKKQEKTNMKKKKKFDFFFYFPFNLCLCQAMCSIPFTSRLRNNVFSRKFCLWTNAVRCSFCGCISILASRKRRREKKKNGIDAQFEVKMWKDAEKNDEK